MCGNTYYKRKKEEIEKRFNDSTTCDDCGGPFDQGKFKQSYPLKHMYRVALCYWCN